MQRSNLFIFLDCHEFAFANSRNDDTEIDCHENSLRSFAGFASESRNDEGGAMIIKEIK